eukprot:jgi/Mesvir1/6044/Mv00781-RA.1
MCPPAVAATSPSSAETSVREKTTPGEAGKSCSTLTLECNSGPVHSLLIEKGILFAAFGKPACVKAWNIRECVWVATLSGHASAIKAMAIYGRKLYTGSVDCTIRAWSLETYACLGVLRGHMGAVLCLQVIGDQLWSGGADKRIKGWHLAEGKHTKLVSIGGFSEAVTSLAVHDGLLVSRCADSTIQLWRVDEAGAQAVCAATVEAHALHSHTSLAHSLAVSHGVVYSGSHCDGIKAWSLAQHRWLPIMRGHEGSVQDLATLSSPRAWPAGDKGHARHHTPLMATHFELLVSGSKDGTAKVWSLEEPAHLVASLEEHTAAVTCVAVASAEEVSWRTGGDRKGGAACEGANALEGEGEESSEEGSVCRPTTVLVFTGSEDTLVKVWETRVAPTLVDA